MKKRIAIYTAIIATVTYAPLQAQSKKEGQADTLRRELTVVTDKVISIANEKGLPVQIHREQPKFSHFAIQPLRFQPTYIPQVRIQMDGHVSPIAQEGIFSPYRGYVELGVGTLYNFRADAGYRILSSEKTDLYVDIHHRSATQSLRDKDNSARTKDKHSRTDVGVRYNQQFNDFSIGAGAQYRHRYYNYYGLWPNLPVIALSRENIKHNTQDYAIDHDIETYAELQSNHAGDNTWTYNILLEYARYAREMKFLERSSALIEHNPDIRIGLKKQIGSSDFGLGIDGFAGLLYLSPQNGQKILKNKENERTSKGLYYTGGELFIDTKTSLALVDLAIKVGIGTSINTGLNSKIFFYPVLDASLTFADTYRVYVENKGGLSKNSLRTVSQSNPYLLPDYAVDPSRIRYDTKVGFAAAITQKLNVGLYANVSQVDHCYFLKPQDKQLLGTSHVGELYREHVGFIPYYDNVFVWRLGGDISYSIQGLWGISLNAKYSNWARSTKNAVADGKPHLEVGVSTYYQPAKQFRLTFDYSHIAGIKYTQPDNTPMSTGELPDISLVNARVDYLLNNRVAFYAAGQDIFFQNYSLYYGYPAQGASIMLGTNINL